MIVHKRILKLTMLVCCWLSLSTVTALAHPHILRATDLKEISAEELIQDLTTAQVIFIGELHDHVGHHQAQLSIIQALQKDR